MKTTIVLCSFLFLGLWADMAASGSWEATNILKGERNIDRLFFLDDKAGWACAYFPGILKSDDGGSSWRRLDSNLHSVRIFSVWFATRNRGWAVGTSFVENRAWPVILTTNNGGAAWIIQKDLPGKWELHDIYFYDQQHGWAVGATESNRGVIFSTMDGGQNWKIQIQKLDRSSLRHIRFADIQHGWAVGMNAALHTGDGGQTWEPQSVGNNPFLNGLSVLDRHKAWIAGGPDGLFRTTDGGFTWSKVTLPKEITGSYLWSVAFLDPSRGWVCGDKGVILTTEDGGHSWRREDSRVNDFLWDIAITKSRLFIAAQEGRILLKSLDWNSKR